MDTSDFSLNAGGNNSMDITRVGETHDVLGEGPVWCDRSQSLFWVDIRGRCVRHYDLHSKKTLTWPMPEMVGSLAVREKGGLLLALQSSLSFFDPQNGRFEKCASPEAGRAEIRFNDGKADRQGRFWAGTMNDVERKPDGILYRYDGRTCSPLLSGIVIPNSLCWSPDGRTMYFADSYAHTLFAYDFDPDTGMPGARREFAHFQAPAIPDGSTVDAEGFVWCVEYNGWRITRFAPDGRIDRRIELPVQQPTSCAFGGSNLDILFVTTASQRLNEEQLRNQPLAGALLALNVGVRGLPEPRFAG
jgi:sugar lactone lactonase YvrE